MGYSTDWEIDLWFDKENLREMEEILSTGILSDYCIEIGNTATNQKGKVLYYLQTDETYGNYHEEDWNKMIDQIKHIVRGSVTFYGEEKGCIWRIIVNKGVVKEVSGRIIFDETYELFMSEYKDIPKDLRKSLQQWWGARNL